MKAPLPTPDLPSSAEDWLARLLSPECSASDHAAFEDWLAASPRNALDYVEVERIHQLAAHLGSEPRQHDTKRPATLHAPARHRRRVWRPALAWAASLLLALGGGFWLLTSYRDEAPVQYATEIGKQRRVDLPDGSGLVLDTNTSVQVTYGHSQRRIELLSGRVQANVAHDSNRPFVVTSGVGSVRAVGTIFQVERRGEDTVVSVLEGRVAVETQSKQASKALELHSLQQLTYDSSGNLGVPESMDRSAADGWTQGRLIFKEQRLADLVTEFNRYSRDQLILSEAGLGDIRVSGAFNANDQAGLLTALHQGWGLQAKHVAENQILLSAR